MHNCSIFLFILRQNNLKRPSIYIILFYTKRSLKKYFNAKFDQNIHQDAPNRTFFLIFFRRRAWPIACVKLISLFLYENSHFSLRMLSKH